MKLEFSRPSLGPAAWRYVRESLESGQISGDARFTARCQALLESRLGSPSLLVHSCTAALEMAALLAKVGPGDEVIMPSFTFVSTANAFAIRGAVPVFVDIRADTLNLDETLLEQAISPRTRAIVPVHYAGVACEMDAILAIAARHGLAVIEDAAQGYLASYRGKPLGSLGTLGCLSFHVTKNVVSGEGGALLVNEASLLERSHILREKGTNRTAFLNRKVDKYQWLDVGSSYLPSDILAALLLSQLEAGEDITARRIAVWNRYHADLEDSEEHGLLRRPVLPDHVTHNGHIYHVLLPDGHTAKRLKEQLAEIGLPSLTHYVPLHSAPAAQHLARTATAMTITDRVAATLLRLPLHGEMTLEDAGRVAETVISLLKRS
jgi:dTDP-4-amino-4,6-dideoxygalactose transaminase